MNRSIFLITLFLFIITPNTGFGEIYKWQNEDESIGFTDDYGKVPEKYRNQVDIKTYRYKSVKESTPDKKTRDRLTDDELEKTKEYMLKTSSPQTSQEIEETIMEVWSNFKNALMNGDIDTAVSYFVYERQKTYRYNFEIFKRKGVLKEIVLDMKEFNFIKETKPNSRFIECELLSEQNGKILSLPVQFARDLDGVWKIYAF